MCGKSHHRPSLFGTAVSVSDHGRCGSGRAIFRGIDMRTLAGRVAARFLAIVFTVAGVSAAASAQQIQGGPTTPVMSLFVRGVDTAPDASGNYLVVGGQGPLYAACINAQGTPISGPIPINATGGYASFPRAAYSPYLFNGAGGFMVVWAEAPSDPFGNTTRALFARPVHCSGAVGAPQLVSSSTWWEPGNMAIAHSRASQNFLVAWQTFPEHTVAARLIDLAGAPAGPTVALSSGLGRDPSVTWNSNQNHYGVSFSGETYSAFVTIPAWDAAAFTRNTFNVSGGILTTMTDVAFNPYTGLYVMSWFEISSALFAKIAEFDAAGNLFTIGVASSRLGSYDAFSLAINPATGTFLLAGVDRGLDTPLGLELNVRGFPFNGENTLSGTRPAYYPRVSSSQVSPTWNVVFSGGFSSLSSLITTSFAYGGGPAGAHPAPGAPAPAPAPTPAPAPSSCPGPAPVAGWVCVNGGWLPPDHPLAMSGTPT